MELEVAKLDPMGGLLFLEAVVVPKPIAFISTISKEGVPNVAPFSWSTPACHHPPTLCFAALRSPTAEDGKNDTLRNAEYAGDFVVNVVDEQIAEAMNVAAGEWPKDVDEFAKAGLTTVPSKRVKSPRVGEAPVSIECKLVQTVEVGGGASTLVLGEAVLTHIRDDLYKDGEIDVRKLKPVGKMEGFMFCRIQDVFEMKPPEVG